MIKLTRFAELQSIWLLKLSKVQVMAEALIGGVSELFCMKCYVGDPLITTVIDNKC